MGTLIAVVAGLVIWIILWATGAKGLDAFLITMTFGILAVMGRTLLRYAPGRKS
jgi:hypothetical protein